MTAKDFDNISVVHAHLSGTHMAAEIIGTLDLGMLKATLKNCMNLLEEVMNAEVCDASKA